VTLANSVATVATPPRRPRSIFRFGVFELRSESGELTKHGICIKLQSKPLQVLEALLENPGELVSREELCRRLWPAGTFVDFENGLNTAANRLRSALGDSAERPHYVETVPRRGYRFICPITRFESPDREVSESGRLQIVRPAPSPLPESAPKIKGTLQSVLLKCANLWRRVRT